MPLYRITDPDGVSWEINGPAGATQAEVVHQITSSVDYKNATVVRNKLKSPKEPLPVPQETAPKKGEGSAQGTTDWLKATKPEPTYGEVLEAGRTNAKNALRRAYDGLKNNNLSLAERRKAREELEKAIALENQGQEIDYDSLPFAKKALMMAPGAGGVLGAGAVGTMLGGPAGGLLAGGTMFAGLASGGGDAERAQLEMQGVDPSVAKNIGLVQGVGVPIAQGIAAAGGPMTGTIGAPAAQAIGDDIKNRLLQDQIQGPRTPENPIAPFGQTRDDVALNALAGGVGGLSFRAGTPPPPTMGGRPALPPPTGAGTPPPQPPRPLPGRSAPIDLEATKAAAVDAAITRETTRASDGPLPTSGVDPIALAAKKRETLERALAPTKEKPDLSLWEKALEAPTQTATAAGGKVTVRPVTTKPQKAPSKGSQRPTKPVETPSIVLPPRSPNPFEPPPEIPGELDSLGSVTRPIVSQPGQTESLGSSTPPMPEMPGYEDSFGSTTPPTVDLQPTGDGNPAFSSVAETATSPKFRRALMALEPVETLPPKQRVQEGPDVSREQLENQNAIVKKLYQAGYQEVSPGRWENPRTAAGGEAAWQKGKEDALREQSDDPAIFTPTGEKRVAADREDTKKGRLSFDQANQQWMFEPGKWNNPPRSATTATARAEIQQGKAAFPGDDVTSGAAVSEDFYQYDKDIDALDRVWGKTGSIYVPWHTGPSLLDPYKIDVKSVFQIYPQHFQQFGLDPRGVARGLVMYVPWITRAAGEHPETWDDFVRLYGPQFVKNGYDALAFRQEVELYLVPFIPSTVSRIPVTTAKSIEAQKVHEHVRQLKTALWVRTDPEFTKERINNDLVSLKNIIESDPYGTSVGEVLRFIQKNGPSPSLRSLAKQIETALQFQSDQGIPTTISVVTSSDKYKDWSGHYALRGDTGEIELILSNKGMSYRTIVHELIHAVTIPVLAVMRQYMKDVDNFNEDGSPVQPELVKRYLDLKKKSAEFYAFVQRNLAALDLVEGDDYVNGLINKIKYYGTAYTDNVHEVLAYALTDDAFQDILHSIPINNDNGLFHTTEMVREFHGITEDMSSLFYEAVKLFNEFAMFPMWQIQGQGADFYAVRQTSGSYAALNIRGPPEIDAGIGEYLLHHSEVQIMNGGHLPRPYENGYNDLMAANTYGNTRKADLFPILNGTEAFQVLTTGQPIQRPLQEAPMYLMGIPKAVFNKMKTMKKGVEHNNVHYFLVSNVENASFKDGVRRAFPDSSLTVKEAVFLLRKEKDLKESIKDWEIEDENRQKAALFPRAVTASLTPEQRNQLTAQKHWLDPQSVDEAIEMFKSRGKDLPTSVWNQLVSGAETYAVTSENPLIAYFRGQVSKVIAEQSQISKFVITPLGESFEKLSDKEKVEITKILVRGDRTEMAYSDSMLRSLGANDRMIDYYKKIRAAADYDYDLWNEKRVELGLPPVPYRKGYLPSIFDGDYKALVKMPVIDEDGQQSEEVVGVVTAFTNTSFLQIKSLLANQFPTAIVTDMPKKSFVGAPVPGQLFDIYSELTKALGPTNPDIENLQNVLQEFAKGDEGRYLGFHVHELAKKGVWGAAGDQPWKPKLENATDLFSAVVRYLEEGNAHHNSLKLMQDMDRLMTRPELQIGGTNPAPKTLQYLQELYFHILRHHPKTGAKYSSLAKVFKGLGTMGDNAVEIALLASDKATVGNLSLGLGPTWINKGAAGTRYAFSFWAMGLFNIAFTAMQLLQIPMFGPQMAMVTRKELGMDLITGRAEAMKAAYTVAQYMAHHIAGKNQTAQKIMAGLMGKYDSDPEMRMAIQYAEDNNLINFTDIERAVEKTLSPSAARFDRFVNMNQRYAEAMTRPLMFLWMYRLERKAGVPIKEALEIARHKTQFVMVPYDSRDRPMAYASMGFYGVALGQLKTFMHSSITQQYYYAKIVKTKKQLAPAAYTAAIALLVQGQLGVIGMQDIDNVVRAYNVNVHSKNQGIKEVLADNISIALERGLLSEWSGVDFYARLRSPGFIQWPLQNSAIPAHFNWTYDRLNNLYSLISGATKTDLETINKTTEFQKNVLGIIPPGFKWIAEEQFQGPGGEAKVYPRYGPPVAGYKRDDTDRILRRLGVRSTKEALFAEEHFDAMSDKFLYTDKKRQSALKLREAYTKGYYTEKYMEELREAFYSAGGTPAEEKLIMKGAFEPQNTDDLYYGKPSKGRAPTLIDLMELRDERKRQ